MVEEGILDATVVCPTGGSEAIRYAIDIINEESNWRKASIESIQKAAREQDIHLAVEFNVLSIEVQMDQVRKLIAENMDVIVISPLVEEGWQQILEEAKRAHIPVLLVDRMVSIDEELYESYNGADFDEEGRRCARWLLQHTGDMVQVSIMELRGTAAAGLSILHTGISLVKGGAQIIRDYLESHEWDIDAIYAHNDDMAIGAVGALKEYGIEPAAFLKMNWQNG